ncbi:MAG: sugar phosphate isomerase/epimerase [Alphaproteobacteria bacterium]|jgi:sugar phosphate isomerase/epimerase|nr:sugar phosphate isomerase/epimerase [Alphaproteobacteria bacterium]
MSLPRLALAVIGDEIGPSLDEMISFCHEHEVRRLDMRTVGGRNLLSMTLDEVSGIARTIEKAGLQVPTFVSPLLKWPADGKGAEGGTVDFAFDPADCPGEDPLVHAFDLAIMMGAGRIRVFSHLHYPGYRPQDLFGRYERLLDLALTYSVTVEVENEPVCNIATVTDLAELFDSMAEAMAPNPLPPTFRPLIDIGNAWAAGKPPSDAEIAALAPRTDLIHLKDRDSAAKRTVPLGDGDIPWARELERLLTAASEGPTREIVASIETHCPQDGRNATARSVAGLRRIAKEIGVEVV